MKKNNKLFPYIISIILFFLIWIIAALIIDSNLILPFPLAVAKRILSLLITAKFWKVLGFTFIRILISFILSTCLGLIFGYIFSKNSFIKHFFEPYMAIMQVTPVVALILIITFWFKSSVVPVIVALLMTLPVITNAVYNGFNSVNIKFLQVGKVYKFSKWKTFWHIQLPAAKTEILSGVSSIFGLTWKVVVAGEVLCIPQFSVGGELQKSNVHLETENVIAITILLVLFYFAFQKIIGFIISCKEHKNKL